MTPTEVLSLYPTHDYTVPTFFRSRSSCVPEQAAIDFESRSWTYDKLGSASQALASILLAYGVSKGERVAHVATNSDYTVILFMALTRLGAVFTPLNIELSNADLDYMIQHSGAKVGICYSADVDRFQGLTSGGDGISWLNLESLGSDSRTADDALYALQKARPKTDESPLPSVDKHDPCLIIYTSGTTGFPKGVVHTHQSYVLSAEAFVQRMHLQPHERLLSVFPLFHGNAMFYTLGGAIACGGTAIFVRKFSASQFWKLAVDSRATQFNMLAALGNILMLRPRSEFDGRHKIRKIYGGPISQEMFDVFRTDFGIPTLIEGYGMSEIPATSSNPFEGPHKVGSIGMPCTHPTYADTFTEIQIVADDGTPLPPGQVGEMVVRTPTRFSGYLNDSEQTEKAQRDGWFLTGDLAFRDEEGYLFFVARKRDIIRRRGENISGAELDRILATHPQIAEAATIGVPAELGDEELLAVLVLDPKCDKLEYAVLLQWLRGQLAAFKVPRFLLFVDSLPHTPTHRVAKHVLKQDKTLRARAFDAEAPPAG